MPNSILDSVFAQMFAEQTVWSVFQRRPAQVIWVSDDRAVYSHRAERLEGDLSSRLRGAMGCATSSIFREHRLGRQLPARGEPVASVPVISVLTEDIPLSAYSTPFGDAHFGFGHASGVLVIRDPAAGQGGAE